jgi:hypothetical protein
VLFFSIFGCSRTHLFHINGARLFEHGELEKEPFLAKRSDGAKTLLSGHYIRPGNNLVILIRKFDPGSPVAIDDETFEKLTIEIKKTSVGSPIDASSSGIRISYSTGASAFIGKGHGLHSTEVSGQVVITEIDKHRLKVKLKLLIMTEPAGAFPFEGRTVQVNEEYTTHEIAIGELTPWLGIPSDPIGKEVYP